MIEIINFDEYYIDPRKIELVAQRLNTGNIVIFPTDSVYALGCSLSNKNGIQRILNILGKTEKHSKLSLLCRNLKEVSQFTLPYSNHIFKTMNRYLPGPYTFVLKADKNVRKYFDNSKSEIGIRIPSNEFMIELFKHLDEPLISTSLNKSEDPKNPFYTDPVEIEETFKYHVDVLVDLGSGSQDVTTVLDCTNGEIEVIREGAGIID